VAATLQAAALRCARSSGSNFQVTPEDVRCKVREHLRQGLLVFVVDASDSMGSNAGIAAAKGAALALLSGAYQQRDRVALITFRDRRAQVLLEPTGSTLHVQVALERLAIGGSTPLGDGLHQAWRLVRRERGKDPALEPLVVLFTDGEANVPMHRRRTVQEELATMGRLLRRDQIQIVVIDTGRGSPRMRRLARSLGAVTHLHVDQLRPGDVVAAVQGTRG
jgi:magnesium chelatase subunit D